MTAPHSPIAAAIRKHGWACIALAGILSCRGASTSESASAPADKIVASGGRRAPATIPSALRDANILYITKISPFLSEYCISCHGGAKPKGSLDLSNMTDAFAALGRRADWTRVLEKVTKAKMPPAARAQPDPGVRGFFINNVGALLERVVPEESAPPGHVVARRLNRYEFDRTVRDLLGVAYDSTRTFPSDPGGHGFDNIGDVASVSPMVLEKYFDAARDITDRLFQNPKSSFVILNDANARAKMEAFLGRAFRRAPSTEETGARFAMYRSAIAAGASEIDASRTFYNSALLAPAFLFRIEGSAAPDPESGVARLTNDEIACRLSYFLWSAMPDDALLAAAKRGELYNPELLRAQADRMLHDGRGRALADNFGAQWLRYREILSRAVDFRRFPKFNDNLRQSMYEESARFFDSIVREGRPILEILDSKESYLNGALADFYGIPGVAGGEFKKTTLPDRRRGGMLTMGSILTVTSYPLRTSPVLRGKYILEQIRRDPTPPPPPDVPPLPKDDMLPDAITPRARLERHRADTACAGCHIKMDPPGLAFENYDGIGEWRDQFQKLPIDASVTLEDGARIEGPAAMKDYLISQKERFARTFAEQLFVYAVGRPVDGYDEAALRRMARRCAETGWQFETLVEELVASRQFLYIETANDDK
ncbi:MAG: DUF1592 domain-containing protein [Planctomycetes bacterium]|nr:DUF1592 domain-containing protein [Planctomycetota bacterium]